MPATAARLQALCPRCGACVPLIRNRWLHVHNEGSADYVFPRADRPRCLGSFMPANQPTPTSRKAGPRRAQHAPPTERPK